MNFLALILRHKLSQTQGLLLGEDVFISLFSHLRYRIRICLNMQRTSSPSLTNKSWNTRAYLQAKGSRKKMCDINRENRLSHRILNLLWTIVFTGSIWIWHRKSEWLRQIKLAKRLWGITEENTDAVANWDGKLQCLSLQRWRMCWWLMSLKRFGVENTREYSVRGRRWRCKRSDASVVGQRQGWGGPRLGCVRAGDFVFQRMSLDSKGTT